jgi:hypothetical protein
MNLNIIRNKIFLGNLMLFRKSHALCGGMFSGTKNLAMMRCKSRNDLASSVIRAAWASSGFAAKSLGTGPAAVSPSNKLQVRSHSEIETVTTESLCKRVVSQDREMWL